jgi:hypothetical protein
MASAPSTRSATPAAGAATSAKPLLGLAQGDRGEEHGQETPGAQQKAQAVNYPNQAKPEEIVHQLMLVPLAAQSLSSVVLHS